MRGIEFARWALIAAVAIAAAAAFAQQDQAPVLKPKPKPAGATVLVHCDLACKWTLDGEDMGNLAEGGSKKVPVSLGQHLLDAATQDGLDSVEKEIEIKSAAQTIVRLELKPVRDARLNGDQKPSDKAVPDERDKASAGQSDKDQALWKAIKDSSHAEDFQGYLDKYPNGIFAPIAKRRIEEQTAAKDWEAIKDSKDPSDYQAYIKKHPDSAFAAAAERESAVLAKEKLAKLENLAGTTWGIRWDWMENKQAYSMAGQFTFVKDGSCAYITQPTYFSNASGENEPCYWVKQGELVTINEQMNSMKKLCGSKWLLAQNGAIISGTETRVPPPTDCVLGSYSVTMTAR